MLVCNRKCSIETTFMLGMDESKCLLGMDESCLYVIASSIETKFMLGMDESCLYVIASVA